MKSVSTYLVIFKLGRLWRWLPEDGGLGGVPGWCGKRLDFPLISRVFYCVAPPQAPAAKRPLETKGRERGVAAWPRVLVGYCRVCRCDASLFTTLLQGSASRPLHSYLWTSTARTWTGIGMETQKLQLIPFCTLSPLLTFLYRPAQETAPSTSFSSS